MKWIYEILFFASALNMKKIFVKIFSVTYFIYQISCFPINRQDSEGASELEEQLQKMIGIKADVESQLEVSWSQINIYALQS